jgi:hypothetical protein
MDRLIPVKKTTALFVVAIGVACFGLSPRVQAVVPAPDGGYANYNTAEGEDAVFKRFFTTLAEATTPP